MHLKLDGNALVANLASLRNKRKIPTASIKACALRLGKVAEVTCGPLQFGVEILDRRSWSGTVEFDGVVLREIAMIPANDMFMDLFRVEFNAGRIVFAENLSAPARFLPA